jgi:hypothetical protein
LGFDHGRKEKSEDLTNKNDGKRWFNEQKWWYNDDIMDIDFPTIPGMDLNPTHLWE